jgi:multidrug efflux pump subunit AcrA (membrane-fusion protein)
MIRDIDRPRDPMDSLPTMEPPPHEPIVALHHAPRQHRAVSGRSWRRLVIGLLVALAAGGVAVGTGLLNGLLPGPHAAGDPKATGLSDPPPKSAAAQTIRVVRPKRDPYLEMAVEQIATVEPYFKADLKTRVSGIVRAVHKHIGDPVRRGEVLVEVDVPELDQEVMQKEGVVEQRKQELRVSLAEYDNALAVVEVAKANVRQREAEAGQSEATREFRRRRFARISAMAGRDAVVANVVDEEEKEYRAAEAAVDAAKAGVEKAKADLTEKESSAKAALVDTDLKRSLVAVARKDLERSRALAAYARVTAPFDGVVTRRNVDPGAFVQNATSGTSEPLLSVARTDLLTAVARFPDNAAPFVGDDTMAAVRLDEMPGVTVAARVTRYSPSIQSSDRTVRVEVDLFNGSRKEYDRLVSRVVGVEVAPLAAADPFGAVLLEAVHRDVARGFRKGDDEELPTFTATGGRRLLPGMTGSMKLRLSRFDNAYVVPSSAVFNRSGQPYVLLVENGTTKQYPVRVQVNDGTTAKISLTLPNDIRELTGNEMLVASRQIEIGEGTAVTPAPAEW